MAHAPRMLPDGLVAGEVRPGSLAYERRWVDLLPGAIARLGVRAGDKVMVMAAGEHVPGVMQHDCEHKLAVYCDAEVTRDRVLVRRRKQ